MDKNLDGFKETGVLSHLEYVSVIRFLECLKIHNGNIFLNKTLRNHPQLNQALLEYEKHHILELEREIFNSESSE